MTTDPFTRSLTGSARQPVVTLTRRYPQDRAAVWAAVTDPPRLARWLGDVESDAADPARYLIRLPDATAATDAVVDARVVSCDPLARLVLDWSGVPGETSRVTVSLRADGDGDGDGTILTLEHRLSAPDRPAVDGVGWEERLAALVALLGGERGATSLEAWSSMAGRPLEVVVDLPRCAADVWPFLVTPEGLRAWWWNHWDDVEISADARPGGLYRFAAPAAGIVVEGTYLAVEPASHLSFTWHWIDEDGASSDEACDLHLADTADGCRLTVRHTGPWPDDAAATGYRQGWEFVLAALLTAVRSGGAQ